MLDKLATGELKKKRLPQEYLDIVGVMIVVIDSDINVTLINKKGSEILGYNATDIIGKNWIENFIPKQDRKTVDLIFKKTFANQDESTGSYTNAILTASGEKRLIKWANSFLYDDNQHIVGILSSGEDITEIAVANERLQASEKRFRTLFENAPFGYQSLDETGHFIEVNKKWLDILGYELDEVIGKWFGDFLVLEHKEGFKKRFEKFKKDGSIYSEFQMLTKDGKTMQVGFDGNIGYEIDHRFKQTHCTVTDITQINIANIKLKESENKYRDLVNQMPLGLVSHEIILDDKKMPIDYRFLSSNAKFEEQIGMKRKDFIGKTVLELFPETESYWIEVYGNVVLTGKPTVFENYSKTLNKYYKVIAYALENSKFALITEDISEQKEKELEIIHLSRHDYLTNLFNRFAFVEAYENLNGPDHYPLGIVMIDVNGLKLINDAYGHAAGDLALKKVANILQESFRGKDVVARIGGDEFAAILPNTNLEEIEGIKEQIKSKLKNAPLENMILSTAIGYEIKTIDSTEGLDEMLRLAENHMYRHKLAEGISVRNHAIKAILKTLTDKYDEERIHSEKVSQMCKKVGQALKLDEDDLKELELAGMYHDIGKISIPDAILNKPGKLTDEEYAIIKTHPEISYQILRAADEYSDLAIHALHHHERYDGKGYPRGLKGNEIPLFSKIISVADSYEAMTANRSYKKRLTKIEAIEEIKRCSGSQFDPHIARVFVEKVLKAPW